MHIPQHRVTLLSSPGPPPTDPSCCCAPPPPTCLYLLHGAVSRETAPSPPTSHPTPTHPFYTPLARTPSLACTHCFRAAAQAAQGAPTPNWLCPWLAPLRLKMQAGGMDPRPAPAACDVPLSRAQHPFVPPLHDHSLVCSPLCCWPAPVFTPHYMHALLPLWINQAGLPLDPLRCPFGTPWLSTPDRTQAR